MMRIKFVLLLLLFSTGLYAQTPIEEEDAVDSSSAAATSTLSASQRIDKLERQMRNQTNLLKQIDAISQQMKDLQGQLEIAAHDIKLLKEQQKNQYNDVDQRLNNLTQQGATQPKLVVNKKETDKGDGVKATTANLSTGKEDKGEKAYEAAYTLLKNKNYDKAKNALQKFIHAYPGDSNIPNAYYWLGNIYLLKNQPDKAIPQFKMGLKADTQHVKTADTLFKLGLAYLLQGNSKQAAIQFKKVKQNYPATQAAKLASEKLETVYISTMPAKKY